MSGFCNNSPPSSSKYLILASTNRHKFFEIRTALGQTGIPLYCLTDFPAIPEAPETGDTFGENAFQKARYYYSHFQRPVLAEDSGLVIPSLGGFPGIRSARVAPDDASRIALVLKRLSEIARESSGKPDADSRHAYYVCSAVLIAEGIEYMSEGRCDGMITDAPDGDQGFGYDPVFRPEGSLRTFGRMSIKEKTQYSHRGRAVHALIPRLLELFQHRMKP
jgi:XTP/dITP diphosphohydrolase